jgi:ADP-ribose pyrophosphatase YjhB (NUDIX family)
MSLSTPQGVLKLITYVGIRWGGRLLLVDYASAPNPDKKGWWIPAPEVEYGGDPLERAAEELAILGYLDVEPRLMDVESFTMGDGNWHVIIHYVADVNSDPDPGADIQKWKWVDQASLPEPSQVAHGKWEVKLASRMLEFG